jgi:hypothetical protein
MKYILDCLMCRCPREVDPLAFHLDVCPYCGCGLVTVPVRSST